MLRIHDHVALQCRPGVINKGIAPVGLGVGDGLVDEGDLLTAEGARIKDIVLEPFPGFMPESQTASARIRQSAGKCCVEPSRSDRLVSDSGQKMLRPLLASSLGFSLILAAACSTRPNVDERPLFGTGVFHPPPKPGASISQTRMCECKACEPSNCCDGPEDDTLPTSCGDRYDFSVNEACGISVRRCSSRCTREVWRVNSTEACAAKRPGSCCQAG